MGNGESRAFTRCPGGSAAVAELSSLPSRIILDSDEMAKLKIRSMTVRESIEDRLERYIRAFSVSDEQLKIVLDSFVDELQLGLELWKSASAQGHDIDPKLCSFKMLDSCVKSIPTGTETGTCYAIDFGGTNFRAVRLNLKGGGKTEMSQYKANLGKASAHPKGLMDKSATATELFDFFATSMKTFMTEQGDDISDDTSAQHKTFGVGFTFSFPCSLRKLDSAKLMVWTKHFETGRGTNDKIEGQDVAELLDMAFKRQRVRMKVSAVMNDTVGTLLSCAYERDPSSPPCLVGIILGTGMNACYYEETCPYYNYQGNIINLECGNFNRNLPHTNVDTEIDFASSNRGMQHIEKMISGAYLGEICRRTLIKVFQHYSPEGAWQTHSLTAEDAASMASDTSSTAIIVQKTVRDLWGAQMSEQHAIGIRRICYAVFDRSAALAAVVIAACSKKTGKLQPAMGGLTVGVDGSLYKCNKFYRGRLRHYLDVLLNENSKLIHLSLADDGSGKGAGIVVSTLN